MWIERYQLEVFTPPCKPGAERYSAVAYLEESIAEVLPYLNATLDGANYSPAAEALTWKMGNHLVAFHASKIAVSNVADRDEALKELAAATELVNQTWRRRDEIEPDFEGQKRPRPMDVYRLLPKTNCQKCGEATCMAFTFGLIQGRYSPAGCPALAADVRAVLEARL